jgi:hypothetical protein
MEGNLPLPITNKIKADAGRFEDCLDASSQLQSIAYSALACGLSEEQVLSNLAGVVEIAQIYSPKQHQVLDMFSRRYDLARQTSRSGLKVSRTQGYLEREPIKGIKEKILAKPERASISTLSRIVFRELVLVGPKRNYGPTPGISRGRHESPGEMQKGLGWRHRAASKSSQ